MQTGSGIDMDKARWLRAGAAAFLSITLHGGLAYAVMDAANVYGLHNVPTPSISVEAIQTIVLETVNPTDEAQPPSASAATQESVAAVRPSPDQDVPDNQLEKPEPSRAMPQSGEQVMTPTPIETAALQQSPPDSSVQEAASESPTPALPAVTVDRPDAIEMAVQSPDPRQKVEKERRATEASRKQTKRQEAQKAQEREQRRQKAQREIAAMREAAELEKKKAAQQAKQQQKDRGAERDQRRSVAARGVETKKRGSGRTTASQGDILTYASLVRARVASNRPSAAGRGTVVVSFGVSESGSLAHARVSRSSGNSSLDQAALSAVRNAHPFPRPPNAQSHSFAVAFHFN